MSKDDLTWEQHFQSRENRIPPNHRNRFPFAPSKARKEDTPEARRLLIWDVIQGYWPYRIDWTKRNLK